MVQITLDNLIPATLPTEGWIVGYRIKDSGDPYTIATGSPFNSFPIVFSTTDPGGTLYEGYIKRDCGEIESVEFFWTTPCVCTDPTYSIGVSGDICEKVETQAPDITNAGYCLAPSTNTAYGNYETRIYLPGYVNSDFTLPPGSSGGNIYGTMTLAGQWSNPTASNVIGPLNREGVWIDSDCNGTKDPLGVGVQTTISTLFTNMGGTRTIYVGVGADNRFRIIVNGTEVADSVLFSDLPFRIWHVIPITIVPGVNIVSVVAVGDGSVNDAVGMVVYDNTAAEIHAATSDIELNILFASNTLRGTTFDVATCPSGWALDTSGGSGNYICRRTLYKVCNSAS